MISAPQNRNAHLASAWTAGVAALFLAIGLSGAVMPLVPVNTLPLPVEMTLGDPVMVEEFDPPPAPSATEQEASEPPESLPEPDLDIPPVPEITPPLTPPEMAEVTPLDPVTPQPKPLSIAPPAGPKPRPAAPTGRPAVPPGTPSVKPNSTTTSAGQPGGTGRPSLFTGSGKGRFPQPAYPSAARRDRLQGSVRLSVTVEPGGLPSAVAVTSSSGHAVLDTAARDQVQRRWRWPAGEVRQFIIPIRFVLQ